MIEFDDPMRRVSSTVRSDVTEVNILVVDLEDRPTLCGVTDAGHFLDGPEPVSAPSPTCLGSCAAGRSLERPLAESSIHGVQ